MNKSISQILIIITNIILFAIQQLPNLQIIFNYVTYPSKSSI